MYGLLGLVVLVLDIIAILDVFKSSMDTTKKAVGSSDLDSSDSGFACYWYGALFFNWPEEIV
jgi:hypothetical protein